MKASLNSHTIRKGLHMQNNHHSLLMRIPVTKLSVIDMSIVAEVKGGD